MNKYIKEHKFLITLIIGIIFILGVPFISLIWFNEAEKYGNITGGLSSPFSSILGSILIFYALIEQLKFSKNESDTNKRIIILQLIDKLDSKISNYKVKINSNIDLNTGLEPLKPNSTPSYDQEFQGIYAIEQFINHMSGFGNFIEEQNLTSKALVADFNNLLNYGNLIVIEINNAKLKNKDKKHFRNLLKFYFLETIFPYFIEVSEENFEKNGIQCNSCKMYHNDFPSYIFHNMIDLKQSIINL